MDGPEFVPDPSSPDATVRWRSHDDVEATAHAWTTGEAAFPENPRFKAPRFLGQGGMGRVFSVEDAELGRRVAIKLLNLQEGSARQRFSVEARTLAQVDHPHVVKLLEVGHLGSTPYIVMPVLEGLPLLAACQDDPLETKVRILKQVAEGLQAANLKGILHRDIKPANILVVRDPGGTPHPYLMDFGVARRMDDPSLTEVGVIMGSASYMSPEQVAGDSRALDVRSDVFSLGVTAYECFTGTRPFEGDTVFEVLQRIREGEPTASPAVLEGLPRDLALILRKSLEKEPARRYQSALAMAEDLGRFLDRRPIQARPASLGYRISRWYARNRILAHASLAIALVGLAAAAYGLAANRRVATQAHLAQRFGERVEQVRALVRYAHLQAPHDIRPELDQVAETMADLKAQMEASGRLARAPGLHALGRGNLALGHIAQARADLEGALAAGERSPALHADLGLVLGLLYTRDLKMALRAGDSPARQGRLEQLQRDLRDPALAHLRAGAADPGPQQAYALALISAFEGHPEAAQARLEEILARSPWFYEALLLEVQLAETEIQSRNRFAPGVAEGALRDLDTLDALTEQLLRIAPSLPEAYVCQADRFRLRSFLQEAAHLPGHEASDRLARDWEERGLKVDARNSELLSTHAMDLQEEAKRAPGGEGAALLDQARADLALAVQEEPTRGYYQLCRATLLRALSARLYREGKDAMGPLDEAQAAVKQAAALGEPRDLVLQSAAYLAVDRSDALRARGEDPRPAYRAAGEAYTEIHRLQPTALYAAINGAEVYRSLFEYSVQSGAPDLQDFDRGMALLEPELTQSPRSVMVWNGRLSLLRVRARMARSRGEDPTPFLAAGREAGQRAMALSQVDADAYYTPADLEVEAATCAKARGEDPAPALAAAEFEYRIALRLSPQEAAAHRGLAEVCLIRAETRKGQAAAALLDEGLRSVRKAVALDTGDTSATAVLAGLCLAKARAATGTARLAWAREAREAMERMIREAPELAHEWTPSLEEVKRMAP